MKFKIKVGILLAALEDVAYTVDKKGTDGIGGGLLVMACKHGDAQAIMLYSTIHKAETVTKAVAEVEETGEGLLDVTQLRAFLQFRAADEEVLISRIGGPKEEGEKIRLQIGKNRCAMPLSKTGLAELQQRMAEMPFREPVAYTLKGKDLAEFVRRALFCIAEEKDGTQRYDLGGMKVLAGEEGYEAHATDGHICARIIIRGTAGAKMDGVLIPSLALPALTKLVKKEEEVQVIEGNKNGQGQVSKLFFKIGVNTYFGTRLLDGRFPQMQAVLESHRPDFWFTVDRVEFKQVFDRVGVFADEKQRVTFEVNGDTLKIRAKGAGENEEYVAITREDGMPEGLKISTVVNLQYFKNIASGSTRERLRIGISDYNQKPKLGRAVMIDDATETVSAVYAIMPVKQ